MKNLEKIAEKIYFDHPRLNSKAHQKAVTLWKKILQQEEETIKAHAPEGIDPTRIRYYIMPDGKKTYHYDGKPFLEMLPPEIVAVRDKDSYFISATVKFRKLEPS